MSNFIVVVFPNETKAYEGVRTLKELNSQGAISLYGHAVVYRDEHGVVSLKEKTEEGPHAAAECKAGRRTGRSLRTGRRSNGNGYLLHLQLIVNSAHPAGALHGVNQSFTLA